VAKLLVTDAAQLLSMDEARSLATDAARSISMDKAWSLMTDMTKLLVMDEDQSSFVDQEKINNQPNLLIDDVDNTKQCTGPTAFHKRQHNWHRNCNDMKKNLFTTKTANFNRSCLCSVLNHEQMEDLRLKGMVFIIVDKPI